MTPEKQREYIIGEQRLFDWVLQDKITNNEANIIRSREYNQDKPRPPCEECIYEAQAAQEQQMMIDQAIKAIDDCWKQMKHGPGIHHGQIKRRLYFRFRKCIEVLRKGEP